MAKRSNRKAQGRNMCIMTYCTEAHIKSVLDFKADCLFAWSYIYHDKFTKDELGDKERKEPHYHLVLRLTRPFTESAISKWFTFYNSDGLKQRVDAIITDDPYESYDYLIHAHSPEKYQFSPSERVTYNQSKFIRHKDNTSDDNAINALEDMLQGKNIYTVCRKYGRDIIFHMPQLKYCYDLIQHGHEHAHYCKGTGMQYFNMIYDDSVKGDNEND